jgi:uncharacterized repeat protein (TIGR01451 family)
MRRIAITLTVLALVAGAFGCSSDAPTPPKPPGGGGGGGGQGPNSALQIRLFTSDPNPPAGRCTLIQAVVTLNGASVPDNTGVVFTTNFGVFAQNGLPLISVTTHNGNAITALCSEFEGAALVRAAATLGTDTATASITIVFQAAAAGAGPFVSFCDPSFGPSSGGTALALHGGRFCPTSGCTGGEAADTRVLFIVNGVPREGTVTSVTNDVINVLTPGFPEATSPSTPVEIRVTLNNGTATPTVLSLPNCFAFGTASSGTPIITAVLPSSGVNEGNTRVTIIGSGFQSPLQVFFGGVEATIVSVAPNQIVVLTPAAFGAGRDNLNQTVDVRVRNATSGLEFTLPDAFRYTQPLQITAISNNEQPLNQPFSAVTIFGHGFQSPVSVTFGGRAATIISVAESELVVLPPRPLAPGCGNIEVPITVTNVNTGDSAGGVSFTYLGGGLLALNITFIQPTQGQAGTVVTVNGTNLPLQVADASVTFGGIAGQVNTTSETQMTVTAPAQPNIPSPVCAPGVAPGTLVAGPNVGLTVRNQLTGCADSETFQYQVPCVAATPTGTPVPTATPTPTPIPGADLAIVKTDTPDPVASGGNVTYTVVVTNNGPGTAVNTVMNDPLPTGTTFVSCSASLGSCSGPAVGTNGTVTLSLPGNLGPGGSITVTIVANVTAGAGSILPNTATVSSATSDPNALNNSGSATTTVTAPPP